MASLFNPNYETFTEYIQKNKQRIIKISLLTFFVCLIYVITNLCTINYTRYTEMFSNNNISAQLYEPWNLIEFQHTILLIPIYGTLLFPILYFTTKYAQKKHPASTSCAILIGYICVWIGKTKTNCLLPTITDSNVPNENLLTLLQNLLPVFLPCLWLAGKPFFEKLRNGYFFAHPWLIKTTAAYYTSILSFCLLQAQTENPFSLSTKMLLFNTLYWGILFVFLYLLTFKIRLSAAICTCTAWLIGAANTQLLYWRGDYIMPGDILSLRTALNVANHYTLHISPAMFITGIILILHLILLHKYPFHIQKTNYPKTLRPFLSITGILILCFYTITSFHMTILYGSIAEVQYDNKKAVAQYGYLATFIANMKAAQTVTIDPYDINTIVTTLQQYETPNASQYPTIIVIQNESFYDPRFCCNLETDKEILPNFKSLKENTQKGWVDTSSANGPTAISEFEFITRSANRFLPAGTNPFTMYIHNDTLSLASVLKNQELPYKTIFFHPYYQSGYDRANIYKWFGFDQTIFLENMKTEGQKTLRGLITDEQDFLDIISLYENAKEKNPDQPLFLFNVTIQNHGAYLDEMPSWADPVSITNTDAPDELKMAVNLMHETDRALPVLLNYFQKCNEKVIILFYGDHQPYMTDSTTQTMQQLGPYDETNFKQHQYAVPYFIWANYTIPEKDTYATYENHTISINYLGSVLLELAGVKLSAYDEYLLDLYEKYPVITSMDLRNTQKEHLTENTKDIQTYAMIQYNQLFDTKNKQISYFLP